MILDLRNEIGIEVFPDNHPNAYLHAARTYAERDNMFLIATAHGARYVSKAEPAMAMRTCIETQYVNDVYGTIRKARSRIRSRGERAGCQSTKTPKSGLRAYIASSAANELASASSVDGMAFLDLNL